MYRKHCDAMDDNVIALASADELYNTLATEQLAAQCKLMKQYLNEAPVHLHSARLDCKGISG